MYLFYFNDVEMFYLFVRLTECPLFVNVALCCFVSVIVLSLKFSFLLLAQVSDNVCPDFFVHCHCNIVCWHNNTLFSTDISIDISIDISTDTFFHRHISFAGISS